MHLVGSPVKLVCAVVEEMLVIYTCMKLLTHVCSKSV